MTAPGRAWRRARVSVVVAVRGRSEWLPECLASLAASTRRLEILVARPADDEAAGRAVALVAGARRPRVRVVSERPGRSWLDAAVDAARGEYLAFVAGDDVVPPSAYDALVAALDGSGSDVAVGVHAEVRGGRRRRVPWAGTVLQEARGIGLPDRPGLVVDVDLTGKLFRTERWRTAGVTLPSWSAGPAAVTRMLTGAGAVDVVDQVVHERHDRQTSLPVEEQDRFRVDVLSTRWAQWRGVTDALVEQPAAVREAWQLALLEHLLPPMYQDAVGGGPPYLSVLASGVADLLGQASAVVVARVPLPARLGAWTAAHGTLTDVALVQDHLADHPHGLPATLPPGLTVEPPEAWRRVEAVDRRLRSRVTVTRTGAGLVELGGAAFVEHDTDGPLPTVKVGDRVVGVRRRAAPDLDAWAARAHEDHSGCGFEVTEPADELPGGANGLWQVTVGLGGREHRHLVRSPAPRSRAGRADVVLAGLRLEEELLCADVRLGEACHVRLVGSNATTPTVDLAGSTGETLRVPLAAVQLGRRALLPAGGYRVEARTANGRPLRMDLEGLPVGPLELVGERLRVLVREVDAGLQVQVASPPGLPDRSARGQQLLLDGTYRAGRASRSLRAGSRTVLLETFRGRSVGDSPGAIGRALLEDDRARGAGLDLAVVVDDPSVVAPAGTRAVPRRTPEWYAALAGSAAYVGNAGAPYWFQKAPGQLHLQTWHGTPLKRIGEDRGPGDFSTWRHRRRMASQARGWDAMVSPSRYCSEIYRSAFGFEGTILEVGYPRNDVLLSTDAALLRRRVRRRLGLGAADRVVLYAPTWREYVGVRDAKPMYLDAQSLVRALPDAVVLVRGHYNSTTQDDVFVRHPRIHDVTRYPDIADLFLAADALVTDYSSVMFDFVLTDRPVVLLVPDLEQYRDVERGFYFDIETESPGPLVATTADVADVLGGADTGAGARAAFRARFCPFEDGSASARVVEYCLDRLSATSSSATSTERSP